MIVHDGVQAIEKITVGSLTTGTASVVTAGTAVQLPTVKAYRQVTVTANPANTGSIYVGDASVGSTNGVVLAAGEHITLPVDNANLIYIDASVAGEGVSYLCI